MIWFAVPIAIGLTVAAIDYFSDDEKPEEKEKYKRSNTSTSSNYKFKNQQRDKFNNDLKIFKEKEKKRLSKKYLICKGCIYYSSKYRIEYRESNLIFEANEKLKTLERDIQYINSLLIEINIMEKKHDKQK